MLRGFIALLALFAVLAGCTLDGDADPGGVGDATTTTVPTTTLATTTAVITTTSTATTTTSITTTAAPITTTTLPPVTDVQAGLFCRDMNELGYDYAAAVTYWVREGSPDRMDADRNGIPCETVYPEADVVAFWGDPLPTTTSVALVYAPDDPMDFPPVLPGSNQAHGSGCAPGTDFLPDGIWFGYVTARASDHVDFDLACIWTGAEAHRRMEEAGQEIVLDYWISNEVTKIRSPQIASGATVYHLAGSPWFASLTYAEWRQGPCHGFQDDSCPVWLYVNGGKVTSVIEQFFA